MKASGVKTTTVQRITLMGLGIAILALLGLSILGRPKERRSHMTTFNIGPVPAIDAATPSRLERATFALG
ncbi:MAG: hypothetical protein GX620_03125 [Chloroflexi bacterium]|nr:hypothetical protein [Chloroflexota bacterium]